MADIKPATVRGTPALPRSSPVPRPEPFRPVESKLPLRGPGAEFGDGPDGTRDIVAEFAAVPRETGAWLSDPRMTATLEAASAALAPRGTAENASDRYAASVIETHLVARRQLAKFTNALLKT